MPKIVAAFVRAEVCQALAEERPERLGAATASGANEGLARRDAELDGIEVRAVGWQVLEGGPGGLDGALDAGDLVGPEIVGNDDVAVFPYRLRTMTPDPQDLTGRRVGRWVVRGRATRQGDHAGWLCECDCGTLRTVRTDSLCEGKSRSCGCARPRHRDAPRPSEASPSLLPADVDRGWLARRVARGEDATSALKAITPQLRKRRTENVTD